jgi:hypothetical protein
MPDALRRDAISLLPFAFRGALPALESMAMTASARLQAAAALRLAAERVERAEALAPELADALARDLGRHPGELAELEALAAVEGDGVPDWHLQVLSDREDETGGESRDVVEARILDALKRSA